MATAIFTTSFEDLDWESFARDCGLDSMVVEPVACGGFELHVMGTPDAIGVFTINLGYAPVAFDE